MKVRFLNKFIVFIIILLTTISWGVSQENSLIEVHSEVDTSTITIGDLINYSILIDRAKGLEIAKPGEGLNLGQFEIKDYKFHEPVEKDGRILERYDYTISVYDTGKFTIPPFPVAYFPDTTKAYKIIDAPAIDIYVNSVLTGEGAKELKDIKSPLEIPFNYVFWISIGISVILLGVIIYLAYLLYKRKKEKGYLFSPPPPPAPAHEVALKGLEELFQSDLLASKNYKEFYSRLSDIMRIYLEGRYFFPALEEITSEIMRDAEKTIEEPGLISDLKNILELSDLVKFAKYIPLENETEDAKNQALNFVNMTKIIYEPEEEKSAENDSENQELLPEPILADEQEQKEIN
jgi:hypothetical protein